VHRQQPCNPHIGGESTHPSEVNSATPALGRRGGERTAIPIGSPVSH
jgi:hypothetical protein